MDSLTLSLEAFSARRRTAQQRIEDALEPLVREALNTGADTSGWNELLDEVGRQWRLVYQEESGTSGPGMPRALRAEINDALKHTNRAEATEATVDRIKVWLSTAILSHATMTASDDDPEELFTEWVTMGDSHVREAHQHVAGQQRPIGEAFDVDGHKMRFPGDPRAPIELWINCRCTLRPVLAEEALAAASGIKPTTTGVMALPAKDHPIHQYGPEDKHATVLFMGEVDDPDEIESLKEVVSGLAQDYARITATPTGTDVFGDEDAHVVTMDSDDLAALRQHLLDTGFENGSEYTDYQPHVTLGYGDEVTEDEIEDAAGVDEIVFDRLAVWHGEDQTEFALEGEDSMAGETFRDVPPGERKKDAKEGRALPDGSYPIDNCGDLRNAIQAIGRAKDPAKTKAHIRSRKKTLGCPDVEIPDSWVDETVTAAAEDEPAGPITKDEAGDLDSERDATDAAPVEDIAVPWHGVLAPEGKKSGDGRGFKKGALSTRPLPLPLTWQKTSAEGHMQSVVVAKIERAEMVGDEMRASGHYLTTPEADEAVGLVADFGRFGVSVDADDADFDMEDMDEEDPTLWFSKARVSGASQVPIPAFPEAWIALGDPPEDFFGGEPVAEEEDSLVADGRMFWQQFIDVAPGVTEDGPGWLTHPVDTDRLRDYWVRGEGAAKIGWGTPGDFNRCRVNLAEYIKPQYLNGYCANRHKDALGVWPGQEASARDAMEDTEMSESVTLTASLAAVPDTAPADWFKDPQFEPGDGRLVQYKNGSYGCPMTITEDGQVFGHMATWRECHSRWGDSKCIMAPHSATGYAHFLLGQVLTDEGPVPCGSLTIGSGHAGERMSMRDAQAHYDNACAVFADVAVGEDEYGIWFAGWVRPGTAPEMIHAARASKLSGDWRRAGGNLELIACLAVNVPGFRVPRMAASVQNGQMFSLVAAGAIAPPEPVSLPEGFDMAALAASVVDEIEARQKRRSEWTAFAFEVHQQQQQSGREAIAALARKVED